MYVSSLAFYTLPGKTNKAAEELHKLRDMVARVDGGVHPRILRNHFASLGAPDLVFEQESPDLETLETQIQQVTDSADFQQWTSHMSELLAQSSKRTVYLLVE